MNVLSLGIQMPAFGFANLVLIVLTIISHSKKTIYAGFIGTLFLIEIGYGIFFTIWYFVVEQTSKNLSFGISDLLLVILFLFDTPHRLKP
jgi:hypothetical protein